MEPEELINLVIDKESFLVFVEALRQDKELSNQEEKGNPSSPYSSAARGWENSSIESFLEAGIGWAEDTNFGVLRIGENSPWRIFAEFLLAGKQYE